MLRSKDIQAISNNVRKLGEQPDDRLTVNQTYIHKQTDVIVI